MCDRLLSLSTQEASLVRDAVLKAVKNGMVEFVTAVLNANHTFVWTTDYKTETNMFMLAVIHRQNEVFQFICRFPIKNTILSLVNKDGNNILHMAATLEPHARLSTVPGAAFLMQREVQWFKVIYISHFISF
jgi:hypothetical protein